MNNNKKISFIFLFLVFFSSLAQAIETAIKPVDLRILIDISSDVKTAFPGAEHLDGLQLLVERLPDGSRAGVWTYGRYVNHLVQYADADLRWKAQAKQQLQGIKSIALHRNIGFVLRRASFDRKPLDPSFQTVILLLSAGDINLYTDASRNELARHKLLNKQLPRLRETGYTIHTLALGKQSDHALLTSLAKETGGFAFSANSVQQIYQAVLTLGQSFAAQNYIPIQHNKVTIDADVKAFTALLIGVDENTEKSLQAPSGKKVSGKKNNRQQDKAFSLIHVTKPEAGLWQLPAGLSNLSRVYIDSAQQLQAQPLQSTYVVGQRPLVRTHLVTSPADGKAVDVSLEVASQIAAAETSRQVLARAEEGFYEGQAPHFNNPGFYRLTLKAEALGYTRAVDYPLQVYPLLSIGVSLVQEYDEEHAQKDAAKAAHKDHLLTVTPVDEDLDLYASTLIGTVTDSSGKWKVRTANLTAKNNWQLILPDDGESTEYRVELDFKGLTFSGREIRFKPKPLLIELRSDVAMSSVTGEDDLQQSSDAQLTLAALKNKITQPHLLITIAAVSLLLSLGLLGFYFWRNRTTAVATKQPTEAALTSEAAEPEPSEIKPVFEKASEEFDVEIELDLDQALEEETELADEWRQLDAQVSLEPKMSQQQQQSDSSDADAQHIETAFDELGEQLADAAKAKILDGTDKKV